MDATNSIRAAATAQPPNQTADLRPTADAAAILRDPSPHLPMSIPASLGQQAEVNQSRITANTALDKVTEPERVLKPYNVTMLPHGPLKDQVDDTPDADQEEIEMSDYGDQTSGISGDSAENALQDIQA